MHSRTHRKQDGNQEDSVFCLADARDQVNDIVDRVKTSGFSIGDVSALFPAETPETVTLTRKGRQQFRTQFLAPQPAAWWTARQSGFANIGALAIPGMGKFVAAGPIIFALYGSIVGSGSSLAGALVDMGISEPQAS